MGAINGTVLYEFLNAPLDFANNYVEILKYAPHGKIEEERKNYNIDDNLAFHPKYVAEDSYLLMIVIMYMTVSIARQVADLTKLTSHFARRQYNAEGSSTVCETVQFCVST